MRLFPRLRTSFLEQFLKGLEEQYLCCRSVSYPRKIGLNYEYQGTSCYLHLACIPACAFQELMHLLWRPGVPFLACLRPI